MKLNTTDILVNGHSVKVTTDRELTPEYLNEIKKHVERVECVEHVETKQ